MRSSPGQRERRHCVMSYSQNMMRLVPKNDLLWRKAIARRPTNYDFAADSGETYYRLSIVFTISSRSVPLPLLSESRIVFLIYRYSAIFWCEHHMVLISLCGMFLTINFFFFHERDLLIIVVVWSANHFYYNGELFSCLRSSSLESIVLPPA